MLLKFSIALFLFAIYFKQIHFVQAVYHKIPFNFQEILKSNQQFPRVWDKCPERTSYGQTASKGDVPYQIAIRRKSNDLRSWNFFCGGAILTRLYVLTAASCFNDMSRHFILTSRVVAGTDRADVKLFGNEDLMLSLLRELQAVESWSEIAACHKHAKYKKGQMNNNIAVLQLTTPIGLSFEVRPVPIMLNSDLIYDTTDCLTSSYGLTIHRKQFPSLQMKCVRTVSERRCRNIYGTQIDVRSICAGNHSCQVDTGSPLVCKGMLTGVASLHGNCSSPQVYTLLSAFTTGAKVPFNSRTVDKYYDIKNISTPHSAFDILIVFFVILCCNDKIVGYSK